MTLEEYQRQYGQLPNATDTENTKATRGFAVSFGLGALKQTAGTLQNIGNVIAKPVAKGFESLGIQGMEQDNIGIPEETLRAQNTGEKVGKFTAGVAEFIAPATGVAKLTKGLSFLPRVGIRTAGDIGVATAQDGSMENAGMVGGVSAAVQSSSPLFRVMSSFLGNTAKRTASGISGVGSDTIEQVLKSPRDAMSTMTKPVIETLKKDVSSVLSQTRTLARESTKNYGDALADLPKALGRPAQVTRTGGTTTIKLDGKTFTLSTKGLKANTTEVLRTFGAKVNPKKGVIDFTETTLDKAETKRLKEVWDLVRTWKNTTPEGLNTLATKISGYKKGMGQQSKQLNTMIGKMSSNTRSYISKRVPAVKELNQRYAKEQKFISELNTYLGTKNGFDTPQNAKAVASKLQTLFTKNKEMAQEVLDSLQGGLTGRQAGREFATDVARSGASIGSATQGIAKAVFPPSMVGKLVAQTGIAKETIEPILQSLSGLEPSARTVLLQTLLQQD